MTGRVVTGKSVSILGMARSGKELALLLKKYGADVFLSEIRNDAVIEQESVKLENDGIRCEIGGHTGRILESDFIAVSPGIPLNIEILRQARSRGIPVFSELEVSSWFCTVPCLAITGSNGKTTTTTLLGEILAGAGIDCAVGGNIGIPFAAVVDRIRPPGYIVLEVSSFQLEGIEQFRPRIAMILNFTADHLDRYTSMDEYRIAKARIYENMGEGDSLILNVDDPRSGQFMPPPGVDVLYFSNRENPDADAYVRDGFLVLKEDDDYREIIPAAEIGIPGPHNLANSAAAALAASLVGVGPESIAESLRKFKGVEHRLEKVAEFNGISFINDSKGTNVDSVIMALRSVDGKIVLIAGGKDKGGDFRQLLPDMKDKVCALVLIGEAADKIALQLSGEVPIYRANNSMEKAVRMSANLARRGETVLLSPGCASFDMFDNYEHRGKVFKEEVKRLTGKGK
jgi:UDP-N-acetylmuramoylalanine--D-glutamate ligase